jgi:hypothetical protein
VPFRATFDCLWCGTPHEARSPADVEGWAQLCPVCVGRAGENEFLRFRLKSALAERARGPATAAAASGQSATTPPAAVATLPAASGAGRDEMVAYYEARAPEYDDWYLRRGRYDHGPIANAVWQAELDRATLWIDDLPLGPVIVELAAGTGWWSPLLAQKGELWAFDAAEAPLDRARSRLPARPRRLGAARSAGRFAVRRLLAQPRPAARPATFPRHRPRVAPAWRDVRVRRFAAGP